MKNTNQLKLNLALLNDEYDDFEDVYDYDNDFYNKHVVKYNYYKWVMVNYKEKEHDYYLNCVKKYIKENVSIDKILVDLEDLEDAV